MTSSKPYLLRAIYDWLVDNGLTPHLMVDANIPRVQVPDRYIKDGQIVLNVAPQAVQRLSLANDVVRFNARFSGVVHHIFVPMEAIKAIYAFENGRGMMFTAEESEDSFGSSQNFAPIKTDMSEDTEGGGDGNPTPPKGRPNLKVIK